MTAYLIANYDVSNEAQYQAYLASAVPMITSAGGKILVAGSDGEAIEGSPRAVSVVLEFPTMTALRGWYYSTEYQRIVSLRTEHTVGSMVFANQFEAPLEASA